MPLFRIESDEPPHHETLYIEAQDEKEARTIAHYRAMDASSITPVSGRDVPDGARIHHRIQPSQTGCGCGHSPGGSLCVAGDSMLHRSPILTIALGVFVGMAMWSVFGFLLALFLMEMGS